MKVRDDTVAVRRGERGVALITVLLVVALATTAAASMTGRHQFDLRRTSNRLALEQAHQVALGGESWARGILARDRRGQRADGSKRASGAARTNLAVDSLDEDWAQTLPPIPIDGGRVTGRITDAQGRFNVNSLVAGDGAAASRASGSAGTGNAGAGNAVDGIALARFERLLTTLDIDTAVAQATIDWLDANAEVTYPGGAEDDYYAGLDAPHRAANRRMAVPSELRLVRGVDAAAWRRLAPHVTALPTATPINVNTASAPVLQAIVPGLDAGAAEQLAAVAAEQPFESVAAFGSHPLVRETEFESGGLAVGSSHFRVRTDVQLGPIEYRLYSWLAREDNGTSRVLRRARTPN